MSTSSGFGHSTVSGVIEMKKCRFCNAPIEKPTTCWPEPCDNEECQAEQEIAEREQFEDARESAFEDGFERYM